MHLLPPDPPLTDGEIVLRMRRAEDVPLIAEASYDPETRRRLDDEPLTPERERDSLARTEEQWSSGSAGSSRRRQWTTRRRSVRSRRRAFSGKVFSAPIARRADGPTTA